MRPLHRIAEWECHPLVVQSVFCLATWMIGGMLLVVRAEGWVVDTDVHSQTSGWNGGGLVLGFIVIFLLAAVIQSLVLLWKWEEHQGPRKSEDIQADIDRLERELGMNR